MAAPSSTSIIIPAFNEADAIGDVVSHLKAVATWREILVIDDGSSDDTAARARDAGAIVVTHPYNKGNGASVKTGIRRASGEFVLIVDGDGQRLKFDTVSGFRWTIPSSSRRAGWSEKRGSNISSIA